MNENGPDRSDRSCYINRYHANIFRHLPPLIVIFAGTPLKPTHSQFREECHLFNKYFPFDIP